MQTMGEVELEHRLLDRAEEEFEYRFTSELTEKVKSRAQDIATMDFENGEYQCYKTHDEAGDLVTPPVKLKYDWKEEGKRLFDYVWAAEMADAWDVSVERLTGAQMEIFKWAYRNKVEELGNEWEALCQPGDY